MHKCIFSHTRTTRYKSIITIADMIRRRPAEHWPPPEQTDDAVKDEQRRKAFPLLFKMWLLTARGIKATTILKVICCLLLIPVGLVALLILLDVLYLTHEAVTFGDPCKIAAEVRSKLASSPRKGLTTKPPPLPKIIHQQWKTEDVPPGLFTRVRSEWKRLYPEPEYKHILWTDTTMRQLIEDRYAWFLETYDSYATNIQRADSSRYFILYTYGGLYADLDYEPYVNFWDHLPADRVSFVESPYFENENVQNSLMSSPVADPFWNSTFEVLQERHEATDILFSTGPVAMDESIRRARDPSWVHVLQCKNFHRIPWETAEEGRTYEVRLHQKLRRYGPFVRTCGDPLRRDDCHFGMHHNAVTYSSDLKDLQAKSAPKEG
jgi:Glycosyltransferase sugar-binding region containing DXD motif